MSTDISGAIELAKDLLRTSSEFKAHDPVMAAQFAGRAYELCDDLGIDHAVITDGTESAEVATMQLGEPEPAIYAGETDEEAAGEEEAGGKEEADPDEEGDESLETNLQLRSLLRQQARVLKEIEEAEAAPPEKSKKRSFRLFGRPSQKVRILQSA